MFTEATESLKHLRRETTDRLCWKHLSGQSRKYGMWRDYGGEGRRYNPINATGKVLKLHGERHLETII